VVEWGSMRKFDIICKKCKNKAKMYVDHGVGCYESDCCGNEIEIKFICKCKEKETISK
jgi:hypothetical protein